MKIQLNVKSLQPQKCMWILLRLIHDECQPKGLTGRRNYENRRHMMNLITMIILPILIHTKLDKKRN